MTHGFECLKCGPARFRWLDSKRLLCLSCFKARSLTAGTILERTRKPLTDWFRAAFLMVQENASARMLEKELKLTYKVAWTWAHKLRRLMALKTTLDQPDRPYEPRPGVTMHKHLRQCWDAEHGLLEVQPILPRVQGCCERLRALDWNSGGYLGGHRTTWRLFTTTSGSLSFRHVDAYLRQTEFRRNHRRSEPALAAAVLMGRFALLRPLPYHEIRPEHADRAALEVRWRRPA